MGGNFSNLTTQKAFNTFIKEEYEKIKVTKKREYLVLSDVLSINLPDDYIFNFHHLGNLFCMDANKDGRFSVEDIISFSEEFAIK